MHLAQSQTTMKCPAKTMFINNAFAFVTSSVVVLIAQITQIHFAVNSVYTEVWGCKQFEYYVPWLWHCMDATKGVHVKSDLKKVFFFYKLN